MVTLTTTEVAELVTRKRKREYTRQAVTMAILDQRLPANQRSGVWFVKQRDARVFAEAMCERERIRVAREAKKARKT